MNGFRCRNQIPSVRRSGGADGSVLMEYAVLCCGIAVVLLEFFHTQFFNFEQGYVGIGREWFASVQLLHRAIALPVP